MPRLSLAEITTVQDTNLARGYVRKTASTGKNSHIIACLGWTESRVEKLREKDLQQHFQETEEISKIQKEVELGVAEVLYWKIDLSALKQYGYSRREITWLESRMRRQAN